MQCRIYLSPAASGRGQLLCAGHKDKLVPYMRRAPEPQRGPQAQRGRRWRLTCHTQDGVRALRTLVEARCRRVDSPSGAPEGDSSPLDPIFAARPTGGRRALHHARSFFYDPSFPTYPQATSATLVTTARYPLSVPSAASHPIHPPTWRLLAHHASPMRTGSGGRAARVGVSCGA